MEKLLYHQVISWDREKSTSMNRKLIGEEPLSIRLQGEAYSVVLRTPGDEIPHVAGFCLAEGIVDDPDDFASIGFCEDEDTNVVTVMLSASRRDNIPDILERRGFISQTSCGICGKEVVEDLYQRIHPLTDNITVDIQRAFQCVEKLSDQQPLRHMTRAAHAAVLYDKHFEILSMAEDVGRHNALDKAIGKVFLSHRLPNACLLVLSSRISYELVQKAAKARIPVILAKSRPTSLAVELATKFNITLATAEESGLYIFCKPYRLV
ncbi:MAG: formate dehydrogenase accessory sulfurtransferase FdhD [Desulfobacterales bacterium]|jgi:FdhD protein|nr:formate dehydrogenase accessory sulfurtransferase FdhD [Desulfobacterales bacterium]